jgi:hypothetical protein
MVRLLVIFRSTYDSVADVCLPIGYSLNWTEKEDSDRARRGFGAQGRHYNALLQGNPGDFTQNR